MHFALTVVNSRYLINKIAGEFHTFVFCKKNIGVITNTADKKTDVKNVKK